MMAKILAPYIASILLVGVMPTDISLFDGVAAGATPPAIRRLVPSPHRASLPIKGTVAGTTPRKTDLAAYGPKINAASAIVIDAYSGATLYAKNPDEARPIGSISKLMAMLVFLDSGVKLDGQVQFLAEDVIAGGKMYLSPGATLSVRDLLKSAVIASDNSAVLALVRLTGLTREQFVARMNEKAKELGLRDTSFADPTGLSSSNLSSARDITAFLAASRLSPILAPLMQTETATIETSAGPVLLPSTDSLLTTGINGGVVEGGKTGYIPEAGYCVTSSFYKNGGRIYVVVLGAETPEGRFRDAAALANWAFSTFTWPSAR